MRALNHDASPYRPPPRAKSKPCTLRLQFFVQFGKPWNINSIPQMIYLYWLPTTPGPAASGACCRILEYSAKRVSTIRASRR
jgi:hypothetical protein